MKAKQGKCPYCGHKYVLTKTGKLRKHDWFRYTPPFRIEQCPGSGQVPA